MWCSRARGHADGACAILCARSYTLARKFGPASIYLQEEARTGKIINVAAHGAVIEAIQARIRQTGVPVVYATVQMCLLCPLKLQRYEACMTIQQQEKCKLFDPLCLAKNRVVPITTNASAHANSRRAGVTHPGDQS
ncbi:hypothetical protein PG1C_13975 [Rugosibacter aromaticivorans]|uniref:Uncharacterized protein n=1 Tax=Rugosibacter aromaticivorans TaxID=1565605 RepID=A0A0C5JBW0_9PROT|nr:hypothetical protein PG1C_13975 [Rugosibacter aromaticivorans]